MVSTEPLLGSCLSFLKSNELYLTARPNSLAEFHAGPPSDCETFRLLSLPETEAILALSQGRWFVPSRNALLEQGAIKATSSRLEIADILFHDYQIMKDDVPTESFIVLGKDWTLERLIKFNPIIFYAVFGNDLGFRRQFETSIRSLFEIGHYKGGVCVVGDLSQDDLAFLPLESRQQISLVQRYAKDSLDQIAVRFSLPSIAGRGVQPILYLDCDVVVDSPIEHILTNSLLIERMSAQVEYFSLMDRDVSVGSKLFAKDQTPVGGRHGFCAGLLAFPNLPSMTRVLGLTSFSMERYVSSHGRLALPYFDQPFLNYVSLKVNSLEPSLITRVTRTGYLSTVAEFKIEHRKGFVHFCGVARDDRHLAMEQYVESVKNDIAANSSLASTGVTG